MLGRMLCFQLHRACLVGVPAHPPKAHRGSRHPAACAAPALQIFINLDPSSSAAPAADEGAAASDGSASGTSPASAARAAAEVWEDEKEVVSYSLLWEAEQDAAGAAGTAGEQLPPWVRGLFSIRFGGPEFKKRRSGAGPPAAIPAGAQQAQQQQQPGAPAAPWAVMWLSGEDALAMERASDAEVLDAVRGVLRAFPGLRPLPPGWQLAADSAGGEPAALAGSVVRSRWGLDPRFAGGYSYMGLRATPDDVEALLEPIWVPAAGQLLAGNEAAAGGGGEQQQSQQQQQAGRRPVVLFAGEALHAVYMVRTERGGVGVLAGGRKQRAFRPSGKAGARAEVAGTPFTCLLHVTFLT